MSGIRILLNLVLAVALAAGGAHILSTDPFIWGGGAGEAMKFTGAARYLLALGLFLVAAFALAVARRWFRHRGTRPPDHHVDPHPKYRVRLMARYWYFTGPALGAFLLALFLAA